MPKHKSVAMLEIIAKGLGDLKDKVVFVGGATTPLYIDDPAASEVRPTEDVDCIIEITTRSDYYKLEEDLRKLGFKHATDDKGKSPICRWEYHGVTVDVMPTEEKILGFSNRWYLEGIEQAQTYQLSSKTNISIFTSPYFIASKIEAFHGRGKGDFRMSPDIEDVISLLDGRSNIKEEILSSPDSVNKYLKQQFEKFIDNEDFKESLYAHLGQEIKVGERVEKILNLINEIIA